MYAVTALPFCGARLLYRYAVTGHPICGVIGPLA